MNSATLNLTKITSNYAILHFGVLQKELQIRINNDIDSSTIIVPAKFTELITIPDLPFESYINGNHIYIGPVLGLMPSNHYYTNLEALLPRFTNYNRIKGLIIIFQQQHINKDTATIEGYYYAPLTKEFIKGSFPCPSAIYSRIPIQKQMHEYLNTRLKIPIFNYPYNINKTQFHKIISAHPTLKQNLPATVVYSTNNRNLAKMLHSLKRVYLKPTNLSRGRGIYHIRKAKNGYYLTNQFGTRFFYKTILLLNKAVQKRITRDYLIQEDIPYKHGANKVDFRAYFQKNANMHWQYSGLEAKIAKKGSIVSNSKYRQSMLIGEKALMSIYKMGGFQAYRKVQELKKLCIEALTFIEANGYHLGDTAIDLIIDKHHKIWLLEVQLNYAADKKALRSLDEQHILPVILPMPFYYAKALADFATKNG